jgi:hypothetical protein
MATPLWGTIVLVAFTYALFASMVGLASGRPWGLGASALAGGLGMVIAGACAATGHHAGAWWIVEGLAFTGLAAGSPRRSAHASLTDHQRTAAARSPRETAPSGFCSDPR